MIADIVRRARRGPVEMPGGSPQPYGGIYTDSDGNKLFVETFPTPGPPWQNQDLNWEANEPAQEHRSTVVERDGGTGVELTGSELISTLWASHQFNTTVTRVMGVYAFGPVQSTSNTLANRVFLRTGRLADKTLAWNNECRWVGNNDAVLLSLMGGASSSWSGGGVTTLGNHFLFISGFTVSEDSGTATCFVGHTPGQEATAPTTVSPVPDGPNPLVTITRASTTWPSPRLLEYWAWDSAYSGPFPNVHWNFVFNHPERF